jgi:hypothetical protein
MNFSFEQLFLVGIYAVSTLLAFAIFRYGNVLCSIRERTVTCSSLFPDRTSVVGTVGFLGLFLYINLWFFTHDVWSTHIDDVSLGVPHTILRLIFVFYLLWIVYWVGTTLLRFLERGGEFIVTGFIERMILGFFTGAAIIRIGMLLLGYANLYYRLTVVLIILPILLLSFNSLRELTREGLQKAADMYAAARATEKLLLVGLGGILGFCLFVLFLKFGLYDGDGDYITHYGPYYDEVIFNHGIKPNSWWYQYYYSRGAGITYLSMLVTDKMAPGLVSYAFTVMTSLVMFSLVRRFSGSTTWGMLSAICYLSAMAAATTVFPTKHHETIGPIIACIVWMTLWVGSGGLRGRTAAIIVGALVMTSLAILSAEASVYALGFLGIYFLWFMTCRNRVAALTLGTWIFAGTVMVAVNLVINYWLTGQYLMTPFRLWFPNFIGWETFKDLVSPYMLYYLSEASGPDVGKYLIPDIPNMDSKYYGLVLHLLVRAERLLVPFPNPYLYFVAGGLILVALLRGVRSRAHLTYAVWPSVVILFLVVGSLLAVNQAQSVIRATGFAGFFLVLAGITAWHFGVHRWGKVISGIFTIVLAGSAAVTAVTPVTNLKNRIDFASGRMGLWEAIDANGWIGARPIIEMRREIGMDPLVAFMNINGAIGPGYLVGHGLLNPIGYSYGNKWHLLAFEDAKTAAVTFKELHINYILLDIKEPIYECAAYAPLLSVETLKQYFDVRWSSGSLYLLTWKAIDGRASPVPDSLVEKWRGELGKNDAVLKSVCSRLKMIYDANHGAVTGIKIPNDLPPAPPMPVHILLYQNTKN